MRGEGRVVKLQEAGLGDSDTDIGFGLGMRRRRTGVLGCPLHVGLKS